MQLLNIAPKILLYFKRLCILALDNKNIMQIIENIIIHNFNCNNMTLVLYSET